jgi:AraC-like DNA-binding protein
MDHAIKMKSSLEYINQNLTGDISLETLAEKAYISKYYYHRLFHQSFGEGVSKYVNKKRMESAAKELTETEQPIIDIALKYQYGSQEAFSRAFKRIYHITPGNYRRTYSYQQQNNIICLRSYQRSTKTMAA